MKHIYQVMESGDYDDYMVDLVIEENDEMEIKEKNLSENRFTWILITCQKR